LWSVSRIHGDLLDHELLGLVALGALNVAILTYAAVTAVWPASASWRQPLVAAACLTAIVACAAVGRQHFIDFTSFERRRSDTARIPATFEILRSFLEQRAISRPVVRMHGDAWADGAGIVLRLLQAGWPVTVADENRPAFPPALAATGQEDALVDITPREGMHLELAARPGNITLRDRHPLFVDVILPGRR
jgi:hypothetical protein